jgi:hypothetical protein
MIGPLALQAEQNWIAVQCEKLHRDPNLDTASRRRVSISPLLYSFASAEFRHSQSRQTVQRRAQTSADLNKIILAPSSRYISCSLAYQRAPKNGDRKKTREDKYENHG